MIFPISRLLRILLAVTSVFFSGCSLKQKAPVRFTCLIEAARPGQAVPGPGRGTLRLRSLSISPSFEGRGFVYRNSDLRYEIDFYREFLVTPRSMLTEETRQWLDASGLFSAILDPASQAEAGLSLEGHVSALYADLRNKTTPKTVLAIQFSLLNVRSAPPAIVFRRHYQQEIPAENRSPEALAKSWSKGLAQILGALEADLAKAERPPAP